MLINNFSESKKAASEFSMQKVIVLILAILVLIAIVVFITKPQILDWIRNQPGYAPPLDSESEMTCDQMKLLKYQKIGYVTFEEKPWDFSKHYYINFEERILKIDEACKGVCMVDSCPEINIKSAARPSMGVVGRIGNAYFRAVFNYNRYRIVGGLSARISSGRFQSVRIVGV